MEIKDIYPAFTITDLWLRQIEIRARQSLYTRKVLTPLVPGINPDEEESIGRVQFALALLDKIEELYGAELLQDQLDELDLHDPKTPDLDEYFGPKEGKRPRKRRG